MWFLKGMNKLITKKKLTFNSYILAKCAITYSGPAILPGMWGIEVWRNQSVIDLKGMFVRLNLIVLLTTFLKWEKINLCLLTCQESYAELIINSGVSMYETTFSRKKHCTIIKETHVMIRGKKHYSIIKRFMFSKYLNSYIPDSFHCRGTSLRQILSWFLKWEGRELLLQNYFFASSTC